MMTRASASKAAADQRRLGLAAVAGITAPVLFVAVFTVEGWRRPGYSPLSMFVSELSLGPDGGVQIANFLVTGALVFVFGRGLAAYSRHGAASRAGSVFLQIIGISLMRPDRSPPIPPRCSIKSARTASFTASLELSSSPSALQAASCSTGASAATQPGDLSLGGRSPPAVLLTLGIGLLKISELPQAGLFGYKGLVQRVLLVTFMTWLFAVATRLHRQTAP